MIITLAATKFTLGPTLHDRYTLSDVDTTDPYIDGHCLSTSDWVKNLGVYILNIYICNMQYSVHLQQQKRIEYLLLYLYHNVKHKH